MKKGIQVTSTASGSNEAKEWRPASPEPAAQIASLHQIIEVWMKQHR